MRFERYDARYVVGQEVVGCRQKMIKMEESYRNQNPLCSRALWESGWSVRLWQY